MFQTLTRYLFSVLPTIPCLCYGMLWWHIHIWRMEEMLLLLLFMCFHDSIITTIPCLSCYSLLVWSDFAWLASFRLALSVFLSSSIYLLTEFAFLYINDHFEVLKVFPSHLSTSWAARDDHWAEGEPMGGQPEQGSPSNKHNVRIMIHCSMYYGSSGSNLDMKAPVFIFGINPRDPSVQPEACVNDVPVLIICE